MNPTAGRRPWVVGHRGAAACAPENTAASLRAGVAAGADAIEIDVGLSADGRAVVLHDATVDRTTSGKGSLSEWPWQRLLDLDAGSWFSSRFAGERLLDIDEALAVVRGFVPAIVEIKARTNDPDAAPRRADLRLLDGVLAALRRTGGLEGATISSTHWPLLAAAAEREPGIDLALTVPLRQPRDPVAAARRIGAWTLHPNRRLCTRPFVARAQYAGLHVIAYVVNGERELDPLIAAGVDGIFTDDPEKLARLVRRLWRNLSPRPPFTLGIDQGSSGTRAVLVSADDRVVFSKEVDVASRASRSGEVCQAAEAIAASVVRAAVPVIRRAGVPVSGVGIASQRASLVIWRESDGRPVEAVRSWRSAYGDVSSGPLANRESAIHRMTGLTTRFPYGGVRLAERIASGGAVAEGLRSGRLKAGPVGAFLAARLAGCREGAVDPSLAQRTMLFDIRRLRWEQSLLELVGVPSSALPSVLLSRADRGRIRLGSYRPPLRAVVGDVGAAFRAVAGAAAEGGLLVLGTGGFLVAGTGARPVHVPGLLTTLLWADADGPRYAIEGTVHGLAASLVEAAERAALPGLAPDLVAARGALARRVPRVLPAPEGLGSPDWDPRRRFEIEPGRFGPDEIVRGTIEGIAERFGRIGDRMRAAGVLPDRLTAVGGLATVPHLVAAIASRLGVRVVVDPRPNRAAVGAAILAR